jgi:hypothetical protein
VLRRRRFALVLLRVGRRRVEFGPLLVCGRVVVFFFERRAQVPRRVLVWEQDAAVDELRLDVLINEIQTTIHESTINV